MVAIMTAEAAQRGSMARVIGVCLPVQVHIREDSHIIGLLDHFNGLGDLLIDSDCNSSDLGRCACAALQSLGQFIKGSIGIGLARILLAQNFNSPRAHEGNIAADQWNAGFKGKGRFDKYTAFSIAVAVQIAFRLLS